MWARAVLARVTPLLVTFLAVGATLYYGLTPRRPGDDAPLQLYANHCRSDLRQSLAAAIASARHSVYLASYGLSDQRILQALKRAAERGCAVTVVCDKKCVPSKTALGDGVTIVRKKTRGLMHQKLLIIDQAEVWIGSANMTTSSLRLHSNLTLACRSPALARLITDPERSRGELSVADQPLEFYRLPNKKVPERLLELLASAKKSLRIAMFTWTHQQLADAVIAANERGLCVEVILDAKAGKGASRKIVEQLINAGVPTHFNRGMELLHHKLATIDDEILIAGSANWTQSAFKRNAECLLVLHNLQPQQQRALAKLWHALRCETQPVE